MRHHSVRIQRKRKTDAQMMFAWTKVLMIIVRWFAQPYIDQERAVVADAKLQKVRVDTRVAEQRAAAISNDVVIKDLKIEEQKMKLKLLEYQLRIRGIGSGADPNWTCTHCGTENTGMVKVCTACNAPK